MAGVTIVPYREEWPQDFRAIAGRLRVALGDLARRIDHIGSTSVVGLASKDVIDIQVTVAALDEVLLVPRFAAAGFAYRAAVSRDHRPPGHVGPEEDWEKMYFREIEGGRPTNCHVRVEGRPNQRYALLFRDYLRAHRRAADAYAELKRRLAALGIESGAYAEVKDPACDLIYRAAETWADRSGWMPGQSDVH